MHAQASGFFILERIRRCVGTRALVELLQAFEKEGVEPIARVDVGDQFRCTLSHDFHNLRASQLSWLLWDPVSRGAAPGLAAFADEQDERVGRVLTRLQRHAAVEHTPAASAA